MLTRQREREEGGTVSAAAIYDYSFKLPFTQKDIRKETRMRKTLLIVTVVFVFGLWLAASAGAQGAGRAGFVKKNSAGGVTAGSVSGARGALGATARAGGVVSDGQGNVAGGSTRAIRGPQGGVGVRAGGFTRSSDGTVQHQSGAAMAGKNGYAVTSGSVSKDSQGNVSGRRDTSVTSKSGAQYDGSTTYSSSTGISHAGTCYDANGNVVTCPGK